jgi:hypothetical protein
MATYIEQLKKANPTAYAQLEGLMSYSANEAFGGKPQDWQAQIFTNLDTSKLDAPKSISTGKYVDVPVYVYDEWLGQIPAGTQKQWQQGETPKGFNPAYELVQSGELTPEQRLTGYTKDLGMVNGLPVVANYDIEGNLTGYNSPTQYRNWINGKQSVSGRWDAEGNSTPRQFAGGGGGFFGGLVGDIGGAIGDIAESFGDLAKSDLGKAALLAGAYYGLPALAGESTALTGVDAAMADLAASAPAFAPEAAAIAAPALTGVDAALADLAASAPAFTPEIIAAPVAAELTGVDAALADLASATPAFTGAELAVPAASGITLKGALDTARAGLLVNALTGDPLGLNDTGGGTSAPTGFAQVPIPEDWKSPTYTYSPVQNVTFEDLFPGVSLQGTQWQNMPQAQTFNEMFASGRQTPMGSPVDINQIVGSILGQSATS